MTDWEIINSAVKGTELVAAGGGAAFCGYFGLLYGLQAISALSPFNEKIKSQEQLEKVVREEAPKAGLNSSDIDARYVHLGDTYSDNKKKGNVGYILSMSDGTGCTRKNVRHELGHMASGDCDGEDDSKGLHFYFVREPRAILYEVFGLKVGWKKNG
jgi:hypothetical protein